MMVSAPIFSDRGIPVRVKIGLAGIISILLFPLVDQQHPQIGFNHLTALGLIMGEMFTGILIGFGMGLLFAGIRLAGEYVGVDMGFSMAQVFDPTYSQNLSVITSFKGILAMLLFLILNGHHFLIEAVVYSYRFVPIGGWSLSNLAIEKLILMSTKMFLLGIKIAAPALVALFLTSVAMGVIARTVPQMNIFFVGFPLRIFVGLTFIALGLPLFVYVFRNVLMEFQKDILHLLKVL